MEEEPYEMLSLKEFEKKYGKLKKAHLKVDPDVSFYERETSILMNDEEEDALITTTQKVLLKYFLFDNKSFIIDDKGLIVKGGYIVGVNGRMSRNCIKYSKIPRKEFHRL